LRPVNPHLLFCTDIVSRNSAGDRITRLQGWCLGSVPVQALFLKTGTGKFEPLVHGFPRPDVHREFPSYPNGTQSGFRSFHEFDGKPNVPGTLYVLTAEQEGSPQWHRVEVNFDTQDIQTLQLTRETLVTDEAASALALHLADPSALEARFRRSLAARRGLTLRLDIINKCNLRCVMCHFSDDSIFKRPTSQLTGEQFKALFHDIGPSVSRVMLSCGDEPLISKFLPEILHYLADEHPEVAVEFCTNAMLMRAPIRNLIMETGVARLMFSMDAVSKPLLESIRVGCRYEQLVGNIMALRDLKARHASELPAFIFNFVMMNRNIHEAPAFVRLAKALGAESIDFRHMVPIGTWFPAGEQLSDQPARYNYYRQKIAAEAAALNVHCYLPAAFDTAEEWLPENEPEVSFRDFDSVIPDAADPREPNIKMPQQRVRGELAGSVAEEFSTTFCNRPFSEIMIRDQDEVLPCPFHAQPRGRLSEGKSLSEIFLGEDFAELRRNMLKPEGDPACARCPIKTLHLPVTLDN
jgi:MoaA/NifB/PqqE/SkfB family radical SAM enzyme